MPPASAQNPGRLIAVITAAGSGSRLGYDLPKALVPVCGHAIIWWALRAVSTFSTDSGRSFDAIAVSLPDLPDARHADQLRTMLSDASSTATAVYGVRGGCSRQQSIHFALQETGRRMGPLTNRDTLLIFDAARCAVPHRVIAAVIKAVEDAARRMAPSHVSVIPALNVVDTMYEVSDDDQAAGDHMRQVTRILDRSRLVRVQTPQGFCARAIVEAHARHAERAADEAQAFGDDAQLIMADGGQCLVVPGSAANMKITYRDDLARIADFLSEDAR